jgi:hypothetical protein
MNIESQKEQNSSEKLILGIQRELIFESCGKDRRKQTEWIKENSERFRQIVEQRPELVWEYPQTKNEIEKLLYGKTIH